MSLLSQITLDTCKKRWAQKKDKSIGHVRVQSCCWRTNQRLWQPLENSYTSCAITPRCFQTQSGTALPWICWRILNFKISWVAHNSILFFISTKLKNTNISFVQIISEIQNHTVKCMKISCGLMEKKGIQVIFLTHGSENKCIQCTPRTLHNSYFYLWNCRNKWQLNNAVAHF